MESEFLIESLGFNLSSFIKVKYLPLLSSSTVVTPDADLLAFYVLASSYIKNLVVSPVDELVLLILEDLEPS
jgi:hypothetical protein